MIEKFPVFDEKQRETMIKYWGSFFEAYEEKELPKLAKPQMLQCLMPIEEVDEEGDDDWANWDDDDDDEVAKVVELPTHWPKAPKRRYKRSRHRTPKHQCAADNDLLANEKGMFVYITSPKCVRL